MPLENSLDKIDKEALDKLTSLEAEQAKEFEASDTLPVQTKQDADRPATELENKGGESDSKTDTETPSDAEKQEIETARSEAEKEGKELDVDDKGTPKRDAQGKFVKRDKKPVEEPRVTFSEDEEKKFLAWSKQTQSKYAHDETKKILRWDKIKAREQELNTQAQTNQKNLQTAINKFNADVQAFRNEQAAKTPTPEKFEAFAQKLTTEAALKEAEMMKAEANGDLDKAKDLYAEVVGLKKQAGEAKAHAEHLRKNPPPNQKQLEEKFKADQKTWVDKANTDYPEFAKKDSPLRNAAIETWKEIVAADPHLGKLPGLIYHCVKYASAKTAADRVPALVKELDELKAKVKEQDALLNPTPSGGVARQTGTKSFAEMSSDEQYEELRREAAGLKR